MNVHLSQGSVAPQGSVESTGGRSEGSRHRSRSRKVPIPPPPRTHLASSFSRNVAAALGREMANLWATQLRLDHLVYEVDSLPRACERFETITGVKPMYGTCHDSHGLQNAVVALGGGRYLEILAKVSERDPYVKSATTRAPVALLGARSRKPRLATFCCDAKDFGITRLVHELSKYPMKMFYPCEVALQGGHCGDSGEMLVWRVAQDKHREGIGGCLPLGGLVPFLIDWMEESRHLHPGNVAPGGCELLELKGTHPNPGDVAAVLRAMRVDHLLTLEHGNEAKLRAVIRHPRGELVLE